MVGRLFLFILFSSFLIGSQALEPQGDFHICYFSLNNEKEVTEMQKFTKRIKEHTHCSISVKEYLTEGDSPEESFQKMVDSGVRCDGLVISGHHTGSFGGKRSEGSLGIDFLEKLSCDPKYSKWFNQVNALWLQGCRTLGTGDIVTDEEESSADYHTQRVGAVLEEDHLEQSIAELNMEFSATLDQDNPLSSRYLRAFPGATVFGWTKTAPGEKAGSQYSIPFHMAHISKMINNQDAFPSDSPIQGTWTKDSAVQYLSSMLGVLNGEVSNQCKEVLVEAWKEHGKVQNQATEYGFSNPDLNAYKPLHKTDSATLVRARFLDCLLKQSSGEELLKVLDEILKDPKLIRYTYNSILEKLKNLKTAGDDSSQIINKLKSSPALKQFLSQKLTGKRLGILRKIDYFSFYEEIYGKSPKIRSQLLNKASEAFEKIPTNSYDELDYKVTLLQSLAKHGYLDNKQGINLLNKAATDNNSTMRMMAMDTAGYVGEKAIPILEKGIKDPDASTRGRALLSAGKVGGEKAIPILEKGMVDNHIQVQLQALLSANKIEGEEAKIRSLLEQNAISILEGGIANSDTDINMQALQVAKKISEKEPKALSFLEQHAVPVLKRGLSKAEANSYERYSVVWTAGDMGEIALPILETGIKDSNPVVRRAAVKSATEIGEKALPILETGIKDSNSLVRRTAVKSATGIGEKALPILETGIKDSHPKVREAAVGSTTVIGKKAIPLLRRALDNPETDPNFKAEIQRAIDVIEHNSEQKKKSVLTIDL